MRPEGVAIKLVYILAPTKETRANNALLFFPRPPVTANKAKALHDQRNISKDLFVTADNAFRLNFAHNSIFLSDPQEKHQTIFNCFLFWSADSNAARWWKVKSLRALNPHQSQVDLRPAHVARQTLSRQDFTTRPIKFTPSHASHSSKLLQQQKLAFVWIKFLVLFLCRWALGVEGGCKQILATMLKALFQRKEKRLDPPLLKWRGENAGVQSKDPSFCLRTSPDCGGGGSLRACPPPAK